MKPYQTNGFTLIEVMIVVVIIGILATIAMPSYNGYVIRSSREAAQTELLEMAGVQEKIYLNVNNYTPNVTGAYNGQAAANNTAGTGGLGKTSGRTRDGKYALSLNIAVPRQIYTLIATPVFGRKQEDDGCITIQENGRRLWYEKYDDCVSPSAPRAW